MFQQGFRGYATTLADATHSAVHNRKHADRDSARQPRFTGQRRQEMERDPPERASDAGLMLGSPYGIRTRAATLRGWCPRPLDERAK